MVCRVLTSSRGPLAASPDGWRGVTCAGDDPRAAARPGNPTPGGAGDQCPGARTAGRAPDSRFHAGRPERHAADAPLVDGTEGADADPRPVGRLVTLLQDSARRAEWTVGGTEGARAGRCCPELRLAGDSRRLHPAPRDPVSPSV